MVVAGVYSGERDRKGIRGGGGGVAVAVLRLPLGMLDERNEPIHERVQEGQNIVTEVFAKRLS